MSHFLFTAHSFSYLFGVFENFYIILHLYKKKSNQQSIIFEMKNFICIIFIIVSVFTASAQVSLDSCRSMALHNNKQLMAGHEQQVLAKNMKKAARTKYLPHVTFAGTYAHTSRELSILNNTEKSFLSNMGTNMLNQLPSQDELKGLIDLLYDNNIISKKEATFLTQELEKVAGFAGHMADKLNGVGQAIVDRFRTDNRNIFMGSVIVAQPIYMGGKIVAANKLADLNESLANDAVALTQQATLYEVDNAYWLVVSLNQKQKLANQYLQLVQHLNNDVEKMIEQGVATKADGLMINVRVNEAEMACQKVNDGISLARMLLWQLCGQPLDSNARLADEDTDNLAESLLLEKDENDPVDFNRTRPELRMLSTAVEMTKQTRKIVLSSYLPQVALVGGYTFSNPNLFNSFEKKFGGMWNVALSVSIPVWNWGEGLFKVRAAKAATNVAQYQLDDLREKIQLQVEQFRFKHAEAKKRLSLAKNNIAKANENLRCATIGYKEGVLTTTVVLEAQTAWMQAHTQLIDAQIELRTAQLGLRKALGTLN